MATSKPGARKKVALTRDQVLEAALAIIDEEGLDALSMRNLAGRLGVGTMAPYRLFRDGKPEILDELADQQALRFSDVPLTDVPPEPDAIILEVSRHGRRVLLEHPNLAVLVAARGLSRTQSAQNAQLGVMILRMAGFPDEAIPDVGTALSLYTVGWTLAEVTRSRARAAMGEDDEAKLRELAEELGEEGSGNDVERRFVLGRLEPGWADRQFETGLTAMYEGLKARYR